MSEQARRILFGVILILAGVIFLVQQIFSIPIGGIFIAVLFAVAGGVFLYFLSRDRTKWWMAIPGFTLLGIAAWILLGTQIPVNGGAIGGALFLGFVGLSFLVIYLLNRSQWWPIVPAGVLITLAIIAGIPGSGSLKGAIFFLGIGVTFALLELHPMGRNEKWPWIPAGINLALGVFILAVSGELAGSVAGWIWGALFVVIGAFFIVRALIRKE